MGADLVIDHTKDVEEQLASGIEHVDMVLSTANIAGNLGWIGKVLRPFGHLCVVDVASPLDASVLLQKSASLHMEMVFSRTLHRVNIQAQGEILNAVSSLVADGRLTPIATTRLVGLTPETLRKAHELVESRRTIGKVIIGSQTTAAGRA